MGLDNPLHIAFLVVVLLLVFGAKRLPEIGRSLGAGMRGFRESISGEPGGASNTASSAAVLPVAPEAYYGDGIRRASDPTAISRS
jgi:sec-independent protein translocase protein TatA